MPYSLTLPADDPARSAAGAGRATARSSSCRSPTRRRSRAPRRGSSRKLHAVDGVDRRRLEAEVASSGSRPRAAARPGRPASAAAGCAARGRSDAAAAAAASGSSAGPTSSSASGSGVTGVALIGVPASRVEDVVERAADEREREDDEDDADPGRHEVPPRAEARRADLPGRLEDLAPRRLERVAEADERQRRLGQDRAGEHQHGVGDDQVHDVRQDVAAHDVAAAGADRPGPGRRTPAPSATASASG